MDLGVILPNGVPGVDGRTVLAWAKQADAMPFRTLAVADRLNYANHDPFLTLAAAAAVTERVRLMTYVALAPLRPAAVFAKEAATLSTLAPGRVTLGVGVGARTTDYEAAKVIWADRGRLLDESLELLHTLAEREDAHQSLGPDLGDVEILIGGASPPALKRIVKYADGYCHGGLKPEFFGYEARAVEGAWSGAGKAGKPRLVASTWYASSEDPDDAAAAWMQSYFVQGGPPEFVRDEISRGRDAVHASLAAFAEQGADEVVFFPCISDISELDWLADVLADAPVTA